MKEHGFLFAGSMVRALLADLKGVTRRTVRRSNSLVDGSHWPAARWSELRFQDAWIDPGPSPMGNPGPYLKVPRTEGRDEIVHRVYPKYQQGDRIYVKETHGYLTGNGKRIVFRADGEHPARIGYPDDPVTDMKWTPSIFLRRAESRIVRDIPEQPRPERIQDITEEEARLEGFESREKFRSLWVELNGNGSWNASVWVWRIPIGRENGG